MNITKQFIELVFDNEHKEELARLDQKGLEVAYQAGVSFDRMLAFERAHKEEIDYTELYKALDRADLARWQNFK